ncbi:MAG: hypothetical protein KME30_13175 [Iphinoe sp. HA4291-MV1]|nr:hypothetical protein [Iphinoe sp. HA4291-MV1]
MTFLPPCLTTTVRRRRAEGRVGLPTVLRTAALTRLNVFLLLLPETLREHWLHLDPVDLRLAIPDNDTLKGSEVSTRREPPRLELPHLHRQFRVP